ncbi:MAG: cobalamin biosynthesis protein CobW [Parvularculales bacterium]
MTEYRGKVPVTIITGFLGTGKTSLIRHLLKTAGGRRLALIINEFGDLGVDGEIIRECADEACSEEDILELANGCLCCTVADDFMPAMTNLLGRSPAPAHIIIETSGLALPKPLVQAFSWPEVRTRATVDGVIALVDAAAVQEGRFTCDDKAVEVQRRADPMLNHETPLKELFDDQLACADMVVFNKTDLLDEDQLESVIMRTQAGMRSGVRMVCSAHGQIAADIILGLEARAEDDLSVRPSHHDGEEEHEHDDFESFTVIYEESLTPEDIVKRLRGVLADHDVFRVKGAVAVSGKPMRLMIQAVGQRVDHYYSRPWGPDDAPCSKLVIIGRAGLDRQAITVALAG